VSQLGYFGSMKTPNFHLSIGVKSIEASVDFFIGVLNGRVLHRDPTGYVNIDLFGSQITLKSNPDIDPKLPDFHFGVNLGLDEFDRIAKKIEENAPQFVSVKPEVWEAGTSLERKKMYLRCPTGYTIELKGYR
jgi:extradiol dioxygenase family protein